MRILRKSRLTCHMVPALLPVFTEIVKSKLLSVKKPNGISLYLFKYSLIRINKSDITDVGDRLM